MLEQKLPKGAADWVPPTDDELDAAAVIDEAAIADAGEWWRETQPPELKGLLDAEAVEE